MGTSDVVQCPGVFGPVRDESQVLDSVVASLSIDVVDNLRGEKRASQVMGHDEPVLVDMTPPVSVVAGLCSHHCHPDLVFVGHYHRDVASRVDVATAFPRGVVGATLALLRCRHSRILHRCSVGILPERWQRHGWAFIKQPQ